MMQADKSRVTIRIAQGIGAISILMLVAAIILALLDTPAFIAQFQSDYGNVLFFYTLNALPSIVLGLLILSRQPGHGVGRLLLAIGFLFSWFIISYSVVVYFDRDLTAIPGLIRPFAVFGSFLYVLPLMMAIGLIPLYFPDGRLPSRRWRLVLVVIWIGMIGVSLTEALIDLSGDIPQLGELASEATLSRLQETASVLLLLGIVASIASLVLRFIRSRGDERTRMKWLVYTAVVSISLMFLLFILVGEGRILSLLSILIPTFLSISIGIAILRHRLWDIDIIIRRTLSYAVLTGLLGLVYYGGLVVLQSTAGALFGQPDDPDSPIFIVLTTLGLAALFNPLRTRIQDFIDRRFYRQKYDAERTLARFSAIARDEVDLENLAATMLGTVEESLQPESVHLWLMPAQNPHPAKDPGINTST